MANKSWRTNRPSAFQFHFKISSAAPVGAHQTFARKMIPDADSYLSIPSSNFEGLFEYMWIGAAEKFIVSTATISVDPFRVAAMPVHFVVTGPELVEVRLAGSNRWMAHGIRREGGTLWWTIRERDVPWAFVTIDRVPQWAQDVFAKGRAKLLKEKESEQDVSSDGG